MRPIRQLPLDAAVMLGKIIQYPRLSSRNARFRKGRGSNAPEEMSDKLHLHLYRHQPIVLHAFPLLVIRISTIEIPTVFI